jgi:hypothetical protein
MCVISEVPLHRCCPDTCDIDVPTVNRVAARRVHGETLFVCLPVYDFHFGEAYSLFITRGGGNTRDHHQLDEFLGLERQLSSLGLLQPVLRG